MGGALLLAAAVGCLACWGWLAAAVVGIDALPLRGLAAYVVGWAGLAVATALLSFPGLLSRWSLTLVVAALAGVALAARLRQREPSAASLDPGWRDALRDPVVRVLAVAVLAAGVYLGALAVLTTPNDWDGLTYHETRALLWDQQDGLGYVPSGNDPRLDGNPPVEEIGLYLAMILPRSERFAALPQYLALWASLLAVVLAARRLGLSRPAAAYGGLVFATLPIVVLHGASILNDLVVASFLLAAVVFLLGRSRAELAVGQRRARPRAVDEVQRRARSPAARRGRARRRAQRATAGVRARVRRGRAPRRAVVRAQRRRDGLARRRPRQTLRGRPPTTRSAGSSGPSAR